MKPIKCWCSLNWWSLVKSTTALFIFGLVLYFVADDYGSVDNPSWYVHHIKTIEETREEINAGYLGTPFQCECGYSPAIAHPSFKDCVEHYKRKYEECCNK